MGTIADSLFTVLMSWVRALVNAIWALFSSDHTTLLAFLGRHWVAIALGIIVVGLVVDWLVWLIRWRPYHLLAVRLRSMLHIGDPQEDVPQEDLSRYAPPQTRSWGSIRACAMTATRPMRRRRIWRARAATPPCTRRAPAPPR